MPIDPEEKVLLHLAGTVALPAPPPARASLEILSGSDGDASPDDIYLRLTQHLSLTVLVKWTIALRHVSALAAPKECFPPDSPARNWPVGGGWSLRTGDEVTRLVRRKLDSTRGEFGDSLPWLPEAVIFVPESAPVLRRADSGLTAAESVEFFPEHSGGQAGSLAHCQSTWCRPFDHRRPDRQCTPEFGKRGG